MNFKQCYIPILFVVLTACGVAKSPPYIIENFNHLTENHRKIAILPYETYNLWQMRENGKMNPWLEQINVSGSYVQQNFYKSLAKKINDGKIDLAVQSFLKTNEILKKNNIIYPNLKIANKSDLGIILNVDALILCEYYDNVNSGFSKKTSINPLDFGKNLLVTASLFDTKTGLLIWRKNLEMPVQKRGDTRDQLTIRAIASFVKIIPYNLSKDKKGLIEPELKEFKLP